MGRGIPQLYLDEYWSAIPAAQVVSQTPAQVVLKCVGVEKQVLSMITLQKPSLQVAEFRLFDLPKHDKASGADAWEIPPNSVAQEEFVAQDIHEEQGMPIAKSVGYRLRKGDEKLWCEEVWKLSSLESPIKKSPKATDYQLKSGYVVSDETDDVIRRFIYQEVPRAK